MAHLLVTDLSARAMIITTLPVATLLPQLRTALFGQFPLTCVGNPYEVHVKVRACLERVAISRVFDVEGLLEVLGELDEGNALVSRAEARREMPAGQVSEDKKEPPPPPPPPPPKPKKQQRIEVRDSEDESSLSSSPLSSPPASPLLKEPQEPPTRRPPTPPTQREPAQNASRLPDLVLVTHSSALLNALFTTRDKPAAHETMARLGACLRALARPWSFSSPDADRPSSSNSSNSSSGGGRSSSAGPLVVLVNSTTARLAAPSGHGVQNQSRGPRDPPGLDGVGDTGRGEDGGEDRSRRHKPSFGQVFDKLLDLHLLCTRTGAVAAVFVGGGCLVDSVRWAVEVLKDEAGVYAYEDDDEEGPGARDGTNRAGGAGGDGGDGSVRVLGSRDNDHNRRIRRLCREKRRGAVDVIGARVVDAESP
ncbi:hypothetical protein VTJ83DRAFT_1800 [Remersonia thermophila]|uniref:Uncharacterized protein n=1 Tax=Remersonia thermophila TaxID=72144 RepID=A0ABR4DIG0_9PEZI